MSAKMRRARSPSFSPETSDDAERDQHEHQHQHQQMKRQKTSQPPNRLDFSIESIMQSSNSHPQSALDSIKQNFVYQAANFFQSAGSAKSSAAAANYLSQQQQRERTSSINVVDSPSPVCSPVGSLRNPSSGGSSRDSSPTPPADHQPHGFLPPAVAGLTSRQGAKEPSAKSAPSQRNPTSSAALAASKHQQPGTSATCSSDSRLAQVECSLDNKDMWDKFHSLNTEMIITKTGRRMFPVMKVQFHNLDPNARYAVSMDIVPVDNKRYRYAYHKSCWQMAGKADPSAEPRLYPHPDSPFNGDLLARQVISFEKVKLTNNEMDKSGHIILNSMHKYQPRVHLIELKQTQPAIAPPTHHHHQHHQHHNHHHQSTSKSAASFDQQAQQPQLDIEGYRTFVFPETVFTAVTAYQNQLITKMKIDKNPFAKGFRDSSRLSDLDRNDPFDYMGPLGPSGRFPGVGGPAGPGGPMDAATAAAAAAAAAAGAHMDAYSLLASAAAANNPWYPAIAAATGAAGPNPFGAACSASSAQAAQLQATQMWLAAFSACLNGGSGGGPGGAPVASGLPPPLGSTPIGSPHHLPPDAQTLVGTNTGCSGGGPDSSGGSTSSGGNST